MAKKKANRTCKHCKKKFEPQYSSVQMCCTPTCAYAYSKAQDEKKRKAKSKAKTKEMREALKTKSDYEKELEKVVNEYVRLRDRNQPCISCDAPAGTYTDSAGHYFPQGSNKNIRFDLDNIHSQCWYNCNKKKSGNLSEYLPRLIKKIGQQAFDELVDRKNRPSHYSIPELIEMKVKFKDMVKELKRQIS